jgi:hypothetical protein
VESRGNGRIARTFRLSAADVAALKATFERVGWFSLTEAPAGPSIQLSATALRPAEVAIRYSSSGRSRTVRAAAGSPLPREMRQVEAELARIADLCR